MDTTPPGDRPAAPMTPVERLRAAADRIERTAVETTQGRWVADERKVWNPDTNAVIVDAFTTDADPDLPWIALVSPDVAPALAAWLRWHADSIYEPGFIPGVTAVHPLAFADLILRGGA